MMCSQIHQTGCDAPLESGWKFCPRCGRKATGIALADARLTFFPSRGGRARLSFEIRGRGSVGFAARLQEPSAPVGLLDASGAEAPQCSVLASVQAPAGLIFRWKGGGAPPTFPVAVGLQLLSDDGAPFDGFNTEPGNWRRAWDTVWLQVAAPAPAHLRLETGVALFSPATPTRQIWLANDGDTPLQLPWPTPPPGFEFALAPGASHGAQPLSIEPRSRKAVEVRVLPGAGQGRQTLCFRTPRGEVAGEVALLHFRGADVEKRTRVVAGVDFGTSGTSVWLRDGRNDALPAHALFDAAAKRELGQDPKRFPTVIYVRFVGGRENGFFIGHRAEQEKRADDLKRAPGVRGLWVEELKSLLRRDDEPYRDEFGPNYSVNLLLRRFLETLKTQIIQPALPPGANVHWCFSLPVLDRHAGGSGALYLKQKNRLETAIRAANYLGPNDALDFFTEPFCAAVFLLLGKGHFRFVQAPQAGDWMCVFDSGGGTTDVILGKLGFAEGELRFEEIATLGGYRNERGVTTFGGQALTRWTAIYLALYSGGGATAKYDYLKYAGFVPEDEAIYNRLRRVALRAFKAGDDTILLGLGTEAEAGRVWLDTGVGEILPETERLKREVAGLQTPGALASLKLSARRGEPEKVLQVPRAEFDQQVVDPRLLPLIEEMRTQIFAGEGRPAPAEVTWVFGVGGNCRVARIHDWLSAEFPGRVQNLEVQTPDGPDDSDRMLAVSGGAVWASKARRDDAMPYSLWVRDAGGSEVFRVRPNDPLSLTRQRERVPYEVRGGGAARFEVGIEGQWHGTAFAGPVGAFELRGNDGDASVSTSLEVAFRVDDQTLRASTFQGEREIELFAYRI